MKTMHIRRTLTLAAAAVMLAATVRAQSDWNSGTITYNGLGNIVTIGQDVYVYDSAGRLVSGSAGGTTANRQEYSYDEFGNRLAVATFGTGCIGGCATTAAVNIGTNRMSDHGATYDLAGNMKTFGSSSFTYDGAGMISRVTESGAIDWQFVYTADDERVGAYTGQGNWRFTVRDVDGKVLREVTAFQGGSGTSWTLDRDHVYREGVLLASVFPSGQRQQFHLDHLGTPRLVTDVNGAQMGTHTLYPFGDELASGTDEVPLSRLKFTGHERDALLNREPLDDMHMRFFSPLAGRFLSTDRRFHDLSDPQGWNLYAYVSNDPMNLVDPLGLDDAGYSEEITVTARDPLWDMLMFWFLFGGSGRGGSGGGGGGGGGTGASKNGPVKSKDNPCPANVGAFVNAHLSDAKTLAQNLGSGVTPEEVLAVAGNETSYGNAFARFGNYFGLHGHGPAGTYYTTVNQTPVQKFPVANGFMLSGNVFVGNVRPFMEPAMGANPLRFFTILNQHGYATGDSTYPAFMTRNTRGNRGPLALVSACTGGH
jgi:RHS repeat-associated protein